LEVTAHIELPQLADCERHPAIGGRDSRPAARHAYRDAFRGDNSPEERQGRLAREELAVLLGLRSSQLLPHLAGLDSRPREPDAPLL
jgi:hypothetical protein